MAAERIQFILIFIFGMSLQNCLSKCWFGAPTVNSATIRHNISTVQLTESPPSWDIRATVTWDRPPDFDPDSDSYVVSIRRVEPDSAQEVAQLCVISNNERIVDSEKVTFANLSFGFLFEIELYTFNAVTSKKSWTPITTAFQTPDCYQATSDPQFCSTIEVQFSGAPLDPLLDSICFNDTAQWIEVDVSWLPPIQVNGILSFFDLQLISASEEFGGSNDRGIDLMPPSSEPPGVFSESFGPPMGGHQLSVPLAPDYIEGERTGTRITSLDVDELYFLTITPIVSTEGDGGPEMHPGIEVEMSFFTDALNATEEVPLCGGGNIWKTTTKPMTQEPAEIYVTTRTSTISKTTIAPPPVVPTDSRAATTKAESDKPVKTQGNNKTPDRRNNGPGTIGDDMIEPITPAGVVIVVLATILVTVLVITTLIVGVHYMRGVAPESPTKLGTLNASGSKRSNGVSPAEENGVPLREDV